MNQSGTEMKPIIRLTRINQRIDERMNTSINRKSNMIDKNESINQRSGRLMWIIITDKNKWKN